MFVDLKSIFQKHRHSWHINCLNHGNFRYASHKTTYFYIFSNHFHKALKLSLFTVCIIWYGSRTICIGMLCQPYRFKPQVVVHYGLLMKVVYTTFYLTSHRYVMHKTKALLSKSPTPSWGEKIILLRRKDYLVIY